MSLIAAALRELIAAGLSGEDLVGAVARIEAETHPAVKTARQEPRRPPIPADLRALVLRRDAYTCGYCGAKPTRLECDHVIPSSKGGPTTEDNLVAACKPCNASKKDRNALEWSGRCQ